MKFMINHPRILSVTCLVLMWLLAKLGTYLRRHVKPSEADGDRDGISIIVPATLTLLGLIVSFTFSMAATRYDQRRLYEEGEANAIGTEYVRADLLPPGQTLVVKALLAQYLEHRIDFYQANYGTGLDPIDRETTRLQGLLWSSIQPQAAATPNPVEALVVSGMNDVLNSQGYTQFSWWNRIPTAAWVLMIGIALASNLLVGYATRPSRAGSLLLFALPILVALSFFLVADIDSPRGGLIRIPPTNLLALQQSFNTPR